MNTRSEGNFLIAECQCYEGDGRRLVLPNNTIFYLCEKCYLALKEQIKKGV